MCDQVPKRRAACDLRRRLEEAELGDPKHVGLQGSHPDFQCEESKHLDASSSLLPPPRTASLEFVPWEGEGGCGLHKKKDLLGDAGSESRLHAAESPFLGGPFGSKSSPRRGPGLPESGPAHVTCRSPNERLGFRVYKCVPLSESEDAASEKSEGPGVEEAPVKDGGDPGASRGWCAGSGPLPCGSREAPLLPPETLDMLAAEAGHFKPFSAAGCLSEKERHNKNSQPRKCWTGRSPGLSEEALYSQPGRVSLTPGHPAHPKAAEVLASDFKKPGSAEPSSAHRARKLMMAPLSSQQDSGFDSPFVNLD